MSVLGEMLRKKREGLEWSKKNVPQSKLEAACEERHPPRGFWRALEAAPSLSLIAEVKKASPSRGVIREDFDPVVVARDYMEAGAHALSVLTDKEFFQGSLQDMTRVQGRVKLPILRKEFILDPYQVYESRALGADAILLIVAALDRQHLAELYGLARSLGLDVLVEVHSEDEADVALALGCDLIGVNNRDLGSLEVDLATGERLLPRVAPHALAVAESGLSEREDVERMRLAGARAVLIGTAFCASSNIPSKVKEVMGW